MFKSAQEHISFYLIVLLSTIFLCYFYLPVIIAPNSYMFTPWADGLSQYFNVSTFVQYSENFFENSSANYPYGGYIVFQDAQPFWGSVLRVASSILPGLEHYSVGFLNILMLLSLWLTPIFIVAILRQLEVRSLLAVLGAMGITFLEPQVFRMLGHFSLSYSCAIPMTIYFMLKVYEGQKAAFWLSLLAIFNTIWLFTHPYLGLMCCMLVGASFFFYWLLNIKKLFKEKKVYLFPLIGFVLPIVVFQLVIMLSNDHVAKAEDIYGMFTFCGHPYDVFVPNNGPLKPYFESLKGGPFAQTWEGWSYIGITTLITLLFTFLVGLGRLLTASKKPSTNPIHPLIVPAFLGSIPILLLSWAFPFILYPESIDYFPLIRQFRSLGRFSWIFYYVSTITSIYMIHRASLYFDQKNLKPISIALVIAGPLLYIYEGYGQHLEISTTAIQHKNLFNEAHRPSKIQQGINLIDPSKYQAILPIPMYCIGSGTFLKAPTGGTSQMAMVTAEATGLPTVGASFSRSDVWESRNILQIISPSFYQKKIADDLPSKKPFLITRSNENEYITPYEQSILDRATLITQDDRGNAFYEISFDNLFVDNRMQMMNNFHDRKHNLYPKNGMLVSDSTVNFHHFSFDNEKAKHSFRGIGALSRPKMEGGEVCVFPVSPDNKTKEMVYSMKYWAYNGGIDAMNYVFILVFGSNPDDGTWVQLNTSRPDEATVIFGDWSLVETSFKVPAGLYKELHVRAWCNVQSEKSFYIDELIVTDRPCDYYQALDYEKDGALKTLMYNNHTIERPQ